MFAKCDTKTVSFLGFDLVKPAKLNKRSMLLFPATEYDDYYGSSYGKSFSEDDISVSPETAQQYLYNGPDSNNSVFDFDKSTDEPDGARAADKPKPKTKTFQFKMPENSVDRGA